MDKITRYHSIPEFETGNDPEVTETKSPMERLDARVSTLNRFAEKLDNFDIASGEETFTMLIDETIEEAKSHSSSQSLANLERIEAINERITFLSENRESSLPLEIYELDREFTALLDDPDTSFLYTLMRARSSLIQKNRKIREYSQNTDLLYDDLKLMVDTEKLPLNLPSLATFRTYDIKFNAIEASIILPPADYDNTYNNRSLGAHFDNTTISLIRDRDDDKELAETIKHERVHGLIEEAMHIEFSILFDPYKVTIELEGQTPKSTSREYAEQLLSHLQTELVAHLDHYVEPELERFRQTPEILFKYSLARPSSEGRMADRIIEDLSKIQGPNDEKVKQVTEEFMRQCAQVTRELKKAVIIAHAIGTDAELDLHTLVVMLQPHQYKNITRYFRFKYGERYQTAATSYDTVLNLKKSFVRIRNIAHKETESVLTELLSQIENFSVADKAYFAAELDTIEGSLPDLLQLSRKVSETEVKRLISEIRAKIK